MGWKRWAASGTVLFLFLVAVGCGAGGPRPTPGAHVTVVLRADGSGRADLWAGGGVRSDRELRDLGRRVAAALFRGKALGPTTVEPGSAFTFARTEVVRAYRPGPRPVFDIAGESVGPVLKAAGYPGYTLRVRPPLVRTSIGGRTHPPGFEYAWRVSPGDPAPAGSMVMHPRLLHWAVEMALLAVAAAAVLTAFVSRDARIGFGGCAAGSVAAVAVLLTDRASGDALGTLGHLSGTPLTLVTRLPLVALPVVALAVIRLLLLIARQAAPPRDE
ncbi:hypothetical protein [Actinoallomurus rhizosphaericola]|uniref:hypothetical protein n=1 Tax=Actinoallomurus rhizosphaericola TaxID=2952536 RepID=UPI002092BB30|nr:hypothetical protein [Actinoallomurus rhizosphaericola]MCO5997634.1 hypothetical protein [Actinoallomurus rhizosphaericola]